MKMTPKRVALLVVLLLFAVFVAQNAQVVEVHFLFWKTQASRSLVLLGILMLGLIGGFFSGWALKKKRGSSVKANS
jgi:uncharacterized integral membrane protein